MHDTIFVVAHLHYVLIGGAVFPLFGAFYYWFPKWTGRMLNERLGVWNFALLFIGFNMTFWPMHHLGLHGMTAARLHVSAGDRLGDAEFRRDDRRVSDWHERALMLINMAVSRGVGRSPAQIRGARALWNGRRLRPPPAFNF